MSWPTLALPAVASSVPVPVAFWNIGNPFELNGVFAPVPPTIWKLCSIKFVGLENSVSEAKYSLGALDPAVAKPATVVLLLVLPASLKFTLPLFSVDATT